MLLLSPKSWVLGIHMFFIFTQGLSFKQIVWILLPVYFMQEIGRSVYFVVLHDLDNLKLVSQCNMIVFVSLMTLLAVYLTTLRQM